MCETRKGNLFCARRSHLLTHLLRRACRGFTIVEFDLTFICIISQCVKLTIKISSARAVRICFRTCYVARVVNHHSSSLTSLRCLHPHVVAQQQHLQDLTSGHQVPRQFGSFRILVICPKRQRPAETISWLESFQHIGTFTSGSQVPRQLGYLYIIITWHTVDF